MVYLQHGWETRWWSTSTTAGMYINILSQSCMPLSLPHIVLLYLCIFYCSRNCSYNSRDEMLNPWWSNTGDYGCWRSKCVAIPLVALYRVDVSFTLFLMVCFFFLLFVKTDRRMNGRQLDGMNNAELALLQAKIVHGLQELHEHMYAPTMEKIAKKRRYLLREVPGRSWARGTMKAQKATPGHQIFLWDS